MASLLTITLKTSSPFSLFCLRSSRDREFIQHTNMLSLRNTHTFETSPSCYHVSAKVCVGRGSFEFGPRDDVIIKEGFVTEPS